MAKPTIVRILTCLLCLIVVGATLDSLPDLAQAVESKRHYDRPYWLWRSPGGHLLSMYPVVTPVLVAPLQRRLRGADGGKHRAGPAGCLRRGAA